MLEKRITNKEKRKARMKPALIDWNWCASINPRFLTY